jgi:hypothetical protein
LFGPRTTPKKPLLLTIEDKDIQELPRITINNLTNNQLSLSYFYRKTKKTLTEKVKPFAIGFLGQRIWEPTFEKVEIKTISAKNSPAQPLFTFTKDELKKAPFTATKPLIIDDQPTISLTIDNQSESDLSVKPTYLKYTARAKTTSEKVTGALSTIQAHAKETVLYTPSATIGQEYVDFDTDLEKPAPFKESIIQKVQAITLAPTSAGYCAASTQRITLLNEKGHLVQSIPTALDLTKPFEILITVQEKNAEQESFFAASCKEIAVTVAPPLPISTPK